MKKYVAALIITGAVQDILPPKPEPERKVNIEITSHVVKPDELAPADVSSFRMDGSLLFTMTPMELFIEWAKEDTEQSRRAYATINRSPKT